MKEEQATKTWKHRIHEIIYEADTKGGKIFDVILLIAILASIVLVMLESVESFDRKYHTFFRYFRMDYYYIIFL